MSALLSLENISVVLRGTRALDDVSLAVNAGEIVALLGPNGAGKTTLIRAAVGQVGVSGSVRLGEVTPASLSARQRALRVAYLPQRPQVVWPVSVEALVALGRFAHGGAPDRLSSADQAAVDAAIGACKLERLRRRRMDEISGGERARAHLARALAQHAPLLLLDEPIAGLDPAQALGVAEVLRAHAASGGAVIISTHDIAFAANLAHRVALMKTGKVIGLGAPVEVLTPEALRIAYECKARLERVGDDFAAIFER